MYVMQHHASSRGDDGELFGPFVTTLWEMTAKEFAAQVDEFMPTLSAWERVHFTLAHAWVKQGGHHMTNLYVDDGRIRYARDAS